ncbi:bifunctional phosphopantothenoylcysteine decarboxylase/phosphopantothenate--cysteine ligase CoaBC, partial [bacterium]|nr:bifunctional phosphopantothenoylcysteine decarboxylase/phosphopantothenate--cysteine ligase CoaBC [bacterium]
MPKKTIILGVTGSIAAIKAENLAKRLKGIGRVIVVMTEAAREFVAPEELTKASGNRVVTDLFERYRKEKEMVEHISLAEEADLLLIAPATANIISKLANGIADDMLSTLSLATQAPILIVPAMNTDMWENPIIQENVTKLKARGYRFVGPSCGRLASGRMGKGRLAPLERILKESEKILKEKKELIKKRILITAGPTQEPLDPVRFISNCSSGRMGYALARAALSRGAEVTLISGPTQLLPPSGAEVINVQTAKEMRREVLRNFKKADVFISCAAVADYRPKKREKKKIKKGESFTLELERNPDILKEISKKKG